MDVFAFREELVAEYERFSRSFTRIRAEDISRQVDEAYASGHFWPAPLVRLNPNFEPGLQAPLGIRRRNIVEHLQYVMGYPGNQAQRGASETRLRK